MRKKLAMILALVLLFSLPAGIAPLRAAETGQKVVQAVRSTNGSSPTTISQEKALDTLRAAFPEIISGRELEAEYAEEGRGANPCWDFKLKGQSEGPRYGSEIIASVNALTGEIISMNYNPTPDYYRGKSVVLTRAQAYPIAQKFLQKIQPDKIASLVLQEDNQSYYKPQNRLGMYYNFYWHRQVDGIKVDWDNIIIGVDASTGKVTHYSYMWHDAKFPQVNKTISPAELTTKLLDEMGLYPSYNRNPADWESGALTPVYQLNSICQFYDAQTGSALKQDGTKIADKDKRILEQVPIPRMDSNQIETAAQTNNKIAPQVAKKAAEEFFKKMGISGELRRSGSGSSSGPGYREEYWSYSLAENENSPRNGDGPTVSINVYTGTVNRFDNYNSRGAKGEAGISYAEALRTAQKAIENLNPEKKNQVVLRKSLWYEEQTDVYAFDFARLVNGISTDGDIRIEIDKQNGTLRNYWVNWHPLRATAINNMISLEKAQSIFKKQQPFELAYIFPVDSKGEYQITASPILVYRNAERFQIDALTGEMLGWGWQPSSVNKTAIIDLQAAPALSLLEESGLLPEGAQPEGALTRRQAIRILVAATRSYYNNDQEINLAFTDIGRDDPDRTIIQEAVKMGIISSQGKFNPNQNISREEMAVWLVNCLHYQDIARMKNAITVPFKDASQITKDKLNYVGLVDGLGLLVADTDQNFRPQAAVSWAEVASAATRMAVINTNQSRY